ncbi:MAG TPA: hypothetical protein VHK63_03335 [Candidatus Limnocylindria bacterium]|nr:hypothetical protein [Candidatus Limnocylindria bacterium]
MGLVVLVAGCATASTPTPSSTADHAAHDPQADRVRAELEADLGMTFQPAGPHHVVGTAPDGVELDLVGVPVEQVVLSVRADDPEAGVLYLPYLRDLMHGPAPLYDRVAEMLACRTDADATCDNRFSQGNLDAAVSDNEGYVVVTVSRRR